VSYMGTHDKVRRERGSARNFLCECGSHAQEWAYNNRSANEEVDDLGRRYSRDLNDYDPMCFRCHRIKDKAAITHCPQGHAYEGENLLIDAGKRKCRECVYARNRALGKARTRQQTPEDRERRNEYQRAYRARKKAQHVGTQLLAHINQEAAA
jgi:hypothetical protein